TADLEVKEEAVATAVDDVIERHGLEVEKAAIAQDHPEHAAELHVEEMLPVVIAIVKWSTACEASREDERRPSRLGERGEVEAEVVGQLDVPPELEPRAEAAVVVRTERAKAAVHVGANGRPLEAAGEMPTKV